MERLLRAATFAAYAHAGQRRKSSTGEGAPFVTHPLAVAGLLAKAGVTDEATLVAAVLHDTVEDTETTVEAIANEFGAEVAGYVEELTSPQGLTSAERKAWQAEKAPGMSYAAKLVKFGDQTHNLHEVRTLKPWPAERSLRYAEGAVRVANAAFPESPGELGPTPEGFLKAWFEQEVNKLRSEFSSF